MNGIIFRAYNKARQHQAQNPFALQKWALDSHMLAGAGKR
jgi:hypothetical protein